jgi:hypothetical protein
MEHTASKFNENPHDSDIQLCAPRLSSSNNGPRGLGGSGSGYETSESDGIGSERDGSEQCLLSVEAATPAADNIHRLESSQDSDSEPFFMLPWHKTLCDSRCGSLLLLACRIAITILFAIVTITLSGLVFHSRVVDPIQVHSATECMPIDRIVELKNDHYDIVRNVSIISQQRLQHQDLNQLNSSSWTSIDSLPTRMQLLLKWHPIVVHDTAEPSLPIRMDEFVHNSALTHDGNVVVPLGQLTLEQARQSNIDYGDVDPPLSIDPDPSIWKGAVNVNQLVDVPMYGHIQLVCPPNAWDAACNRTDAAVTQLTWEIRYIFVYAYNGNLDLMGFIPVGSHTGDLEHVLLHIPWNEDHSMSDEQVYDQSTIYYARHYCDGEFYQLGDEHSDGGHKVQVMHTVDMPSIVERWNTSEVVGVLVNGSHPIVYSGHNSHASYTQCGVLPRSTWKRDIFPHDRVDGAGAVWWPMQVIPLAPDPDMMPFIEVVGGNLMYEFRGLWGLIPGLATTYWFSQVTGCSNRDLFQTIRSQTGVSPFVAGMLICVILLTLLAGMLSCGLWCRDAKLKLCPRCCQDDSSFVDSDDESERAMDSGIDSENEV